ncbi:nicotinate-nicotinamide nucleotide adenylyltransferase [Vibrio profundum]|uniref:nicotinate-nicotinamide nucleotide adenylyltransferase n=1 Tax=Vibrio profundum TaxID=2910247 RepID=UPI003D109014
MSKIAVFGSAFNPPSLGHKSVIESLSHYDKVLLVPSISHAWGKEMADYSLRCELLAGFVTDIALPNVELSKVEEQLYVPGTSVTTFAVLSELQQNFPDADITFIMGPDNIVNFTKFYRYDEILRRWSLLACPEKVAIRSTQIRDNLLAGNSIAGLTTPSVAKLLDEQRIYHSS